MVEGLASDMASMYVYKLLNSNFQKLVYGDIVTYCWGEGDIAPGLMGWLGRKNSEDEVTEKAHVLRILLLAYEAFAFHSRSASVTSMSADK